VKQWRTLPSDADAKFDAIVNIDAAQLKPMITFGNNPGMGIAIDETVPDPDRIADKGERASLQKALTYMGLQPRQKLLGQKVDVVFIGSCTNGRISDLRAAAQIMNGRKVAANTRTLVVPGSPAVKRQAEAEGLDKIFIASGAEWREAGCSMCIAMNGDEIKAGQYCVSTSNRNFEGRQGKGGRTLLASPLTAAAAAVTGVVTDVRTLL
jgi:3-isopropylmalate/(R)-2-methylmalate dehydratase large subunit